MLWLRSAAGVGWTEGACGSGGGVPWARLAVCDAALRRALDVLDVLVQRAVGRLERRRHPLGLARRPHLRSTQPQTTHQPKRATRLLPLYIVRRQCITRLTRVRGRRRRLVCRPRAGGRVCTHNHTFHSRHRKRDVSPRMWGVGTVFARCCIESAARRRIERARPPPRLSQVMGNLFPCRLTRRSSRLSELCPPRFADATQLTV
jgi:hypothetical protein